MLIISRKPGESFEIGNSVVATVLNIHRSHQIRIGIEAPKGIAVHRSEIAKRIKLENAGVVPGREAK